MNTTETQSRHSVQRMVRRCVICGARVRNQNPKTETCDSICTAAKWRNRTREEQIRHELAHPKDPTNSDSGQPYEEWMDYGETQRFEE